MLAEDVVLYGDGGGRAPAARKPVVGAVQVARFLAGLGRQAGTLRIRVESVEVNGGPGIRALDPDGRLVSVLSLELAPDGRIGELRSVVNPEKLRHLGPVGDLAALFGSRG